MFLQYFVNWKDNSEEEGKAMHLRAAERSKMFVSQPTFVGIVMTGKSKKRYLTQITYV